MYKKCKMKNIKIIGIMIMFILLSIPSLAMISTFNNGKSSETLIYGQEYGFKNVNERFFRIPISAKFINATINLTGNFYYHSVYDEFDYYSTTTLNNNLWSSTLTGSGSSLILDSTKAILTTFADDPVNTVHIFANNNATSYANLKQNVSLLIHYDYNIDCGSNIHNSQASSQVIISNGTTDIIIQEDQISCTGLGTLHKEAINIWKLNFNTSGTVDIYNASNNVYISQTDLSSLQGNNWFIKFKSIANITGTPSVNDYSDTILNIIDIGYQTNQSLYLDWNMSKSYPNGTLVNVGGTNTHNINTLTSSPYILDIKQNLTDVISACTCTGCTVSGADCLVSFNMNPNTGSNITINSINIENTFDFQLFLVQEDTGNPTNVSNLSVCKIINDINQTVFDFKDAGNISNYTFAADSGTKFRVILGHYGGQTINRFFDTGMVNSSFKICANHIDVQHYEQIMVSAQNRKVILESEFTDCLILADYTRFALEESQTINAFTTARPYNLYAWADNVRINLAGIFGDSANQINLDTLEFQKKSYNTNILTDSINIEKIPDTNTFKIYYRNGRESNIFANMVISNTNTSEILFNSSSFNDTNEITVFVDISLYDWVNTTLFKVQVNTIDNQDTEKSIKMFFTPQLKTGIIDPHFAVAISILLTLFTLTITIRKLTFSWFGIVTQLLTIALLSFAVKTWYVNTILTAQILILIFIVITLVKQTYPVVVT